MFEIEYKGTNSVIISTKNAKLIVDPKLSVVGLKDLSVKNGVELATEERFAIIDSDANLVIDGPGEYGVAGFDIRGIAARRHIDSETQGLLSTIYRVKVGETRIGIIGNIDKKLSDEQLEDLGILDILIIPIGGGGYTLDAVDAATIVRQIDPKLVMPVHYADASVKYEVPQDELKLFVTDLGVPVETVVKCKQKQTPVSTGALSIVEITRS